MMNPEIRVLLVEDNPAEANLIGIQLGCAPGQRYAMDHAPCIEDGERALARARYDVILLDYNLPDCDGLEGLARILGLARGTPVIMLTSHTDEEVAMDAVRLGAQDYLIKREADTRMLTRAIRYAMERQASREALRQSEERYALALAGANDGIWDWDITSDRVHYSTRWKEMLGLADSETGNRREDWFSRIHGDDIESFTQALDAHLVGAIPYFEYEHRMLTPHGGYLWVLCRGLAIRDGEGNPVRMAGSLSDVSRRKHMEAQLMHEALHDALTGLPNRTLFLDRLQQALMNATRSKSYDFAVLYIDLDRFKNINDSLGHSTGDALLRAVSQRLSSFIRPCDTLARLGGDEFALLVFEGQDPNAVTLVADRIQQLLAEKFVINNTELFLGASIGIAMGSGKYNLPEEIVRDADLAMYRAKHSDTRRCEIFDTHMRHKAMNKMKIESDLRNALANNEFELGYQPIISITTGEISGFEALIRWQHPGLGLLYPDAFIEVAEESGLIVPMSWWVIEEACREIGKLNRAHPACNNIAVSVNISGKLFNTSHTAKRLLGILEALDFDPRHLHLEITEHSIMNHQHLSIRELDTLREAGIGLHIDDFGTGYSSLSHLQKYSYDTLKIDSSFVSKMGVSQDSDAIVKSIVAMAKMLGMDVVAEGVETEDQLRWLTDIGCPHVQGFLFSPAVSKTELSKLLTASWLKSEEELH